MKWRQPARVSTGRTTCCRRRGDGPGYFPAVWATKPGRKDSVGVGVQSSDINRQDNIRRASAAFREQALHQSLGGEDNIDPRPRLFFKRLEKRFNEEGLPMRINIQLCGRVVAISGALTGARPKHQQCFKSCLQIHAPIFPLSNVFNRMFLPSSPRSPGQRQDFCNTCNNWSFHQILPSLPVF